MISCRTLTGAPCVWLLLFLAATAADAVYEPQAGENHVGFRKFDVSYQGSDDSERKRSVMVWYPTSATAKRHNYRGQVGFATPDGEVATGKHPVILFSHGFLGMPDQSIFLTEGLARRGYIVAGIAHADGILVKREKPIPKPEFENAKSWTEDKFRDRREDVVALLEHLLAQNKIADSAWKGRVNVAAVGVAGHSLGGYTALGLIGGWKQSTDKRFKAALALSPYSAPYHTQGDLAGVEVPVMFQGGTFDWGITPLVPATYKKLTGPKYYLVLKNETHFGWTNLIALGKTTTEAVEGGNAELMLEYSVAFFDRHLLGKKEGKLLEEKNSRLNSYEFVGK